LVKSLLPTCLVAVAMLSISLCLGADSQENSISKLAQPKFSVPGGLFTNSVSVRLTANSPSEVVRYTLDGSEPTSTSPEFSSPLKIAESTLLKAKVFGSGSSTSPTVSESYVFMDPDLAGFTSNLPLILLDTFGERVPFG